VHRAAAAFAIPLEGARIVRRAGDPVDERKMMKKATTITCLFVDIEGVLLTDGWDLRARKRAAAHFKLKWTEMEDRTTASLHWRVRTAGKIRQMAPSGL
jgi:hypothetical protein